jgi:flagellar L-ring protein precursor FlgH
MNGRQIRTLGWLFPAGLVLAIGAGADRLPSSSAGPGSPGAHRPMTLAEADWAYQPPEEKPQLKLNDLLFVQVDEKTEVISEGEMDRRKKADNSLVLKDWISLAGFNLKPDAQSEGDPAVTNQMQSKFRSEAELETRDSMKFQIACRVVDQRPNGNLVIEGRKSIRNNNDSWDLWLFGVIQSKDVLPDRTVLSKCVGDLRIIKRESGHVRDGYRRGWFMRLLDRLQPF